MPTDAYDLVVVGTGFASVFFLDAWLATAPPTARVLVLERGEHRDHAWQVARPEALRHASQDAFTNLTPDKYWRFAVALGGASACWWGCTPRMFPEDFRLRSTWGVGRDWPVSYDDLEAHYCDVEDVMQVAGSPDAPWPRSRPYPQPPHRLSGPDRVLAAAFPGRFGPQPTARPTRAVGSRPACCANGVCSTCPIDSKFTVLNTCMDVLHDPRVTLTTGAMVTEVETAGSVATGVRWREGSTDRRADASLVAVGANAFFNPWLLLRSGITDGPVGVGVNEQRAVTVTVQLTDVDAYDGSTSITGHGYLFATGAHRAERAGALVETLNMPMIQDVRGRWRRKWLIKFLMEDLPRDDNTVTVDPDDPDKPAVTYHGPSDYLQRAADDLQPWLDTLLAPLAVDSVRIGDLARTEAHILGSARMGDDPADSVVDRGLVHHRVRNLLVLGGSAFPTSPPANPSLTIAALSRFAAARLR